MRSLALAIFALATYAPVATAQAQVSGTTPPSLTVLYNGNDAMGCHVQVTHDDRENWPIDIPIGASSEAFSLGKGTARIICTNVGAKLLLLLFFIKLEVGMSLTVIQP